MEDLVLAKSAYLPGVSFNVNTGILSISGRSVSENPVPFYQNLQDWVCSYFQKPHSKTVLSFEMEYVNSSSAKLVYNIIEVVDQFAEKGCNCEVLWHFEHDDESMEELGLHFQGSFNVPFSMIETD